jgi:hypothetical protein
LAQVRGNEAVEIENDSGIFFNRHRNVAGYSINATNRDHGLYWSDLGCCRDFAVDFQFPSRAIFGLER